MYQLKFLSAPSSLEVIFGMVIFRVFASLENVLLPRAHQTFNGPDGSIGQTADGVQLDLGSDLHQHVHLTLLQLTTFHSTHDVIDPRQAFTTGCALTTGFVHAEVREVADSSNLPVRINIKLYHIDGFVHGDDGSRAQTRLEGAQGVIVHQGHIGHTLLVSEDNINDDSYLVQSTSGGSSGNDSLEIVPASTNTTTMLLKKFLQGNGHLLFHNTRIIHMTTQSKQLHTMIVLATKAVEPVGATTENGRSYGHGLTVSDGGGTAVQTGIGGEWRLQTRLALLAFQRL